MINSHRPRLRAGLRRNRTAASIAVLTTALTVTGLAVTPGVSSAAPADCIQPFPVDQLTDGQVVTGLTVSKGTTPEGFTGSVIGVLDDGIAPGIDMIMARLTSPEIDRVGGIWQGMSGSPVYAGDGSLIGAVSYGLAWGPSPVAGITPAADMLRLFSETPTGAAAKAAEGADQVAIPRRVARELVTSGVANQAAVNNGMERLPIPLGVSGLTKERMAHIPKTLGLSGVRVHRTGAVSAEAVAAPIVPGGNLAASLSYGDVSSVGVGTATAVCGDEVIGFGHPMTFTGPSQLTLHGADALMIQEDPVSAPFKLANVTAPIGGIFSDRMAGLMGVQTASQIPATAEVTSHVDVTGEPSRDGTTLISVPDQVPDIAAYHLMADQDRVFDAISGGNATVGWTVTGTRSGGRTFSFTRSDRYSNGYDVSGEPVGDLYEQLANVQFNETEDVKITDVRTTSAMSRQVRTYNLGQVRILQRQRWRVLRTDQPLMVRAGSAVRFRVRLTSRQLPARDVFLRVDIPRTARGKFGFIELSGGNSGGGGEFEGLGEEPSTPSGPPSLDALIAQIASAPRNDQVLASLTLLRNNDTFVTRTGRKQLDTVVNGGMMMEVMVTP